MRNHLHILVLHKLDIMKNDLVDLPENMGQLRKMECLYAQHNDIVTLPNFNGCEMLKEIHISNNFIKVTHSINLLNII